MKLKKVLCLMTFPSAALVLQQPGPLCRLLLSISDPLLYAKSLFISSMISINLTKT